MFQGLSEKLPTIHPALLLAPLAIAAWMLAPGFAPGDAAHPAAPNPFLAAWDAARAALTGNKAEPATIAGVAGSTTPASDGVVTGTEQVSAATPQVIVLPGGSQPAGAAPTANPGASSGPSPGANSGVRSSAWPNAAQQPQTPGQMQPQARAVMNSAPSTPAPVANIASRDVASAPTERPAFEPARVAQPVVMTPPAFSRPPAVFARPFMPMPGPAYGRPMMGRPVVTAFGGRRR
jgi:hypothetical protein